MSTRGSIDDAQQVRDDGPASPRTAAPGPRTAVAGAGIAEQLRQAAVYVETAEVLERRAGRADDPALAALLRERANVRRRTADRLRATLPDQGSPASAPRGAAGWR